MIENGDGTFRYVPERWRENGEQFTYAAFDGLAQSEPATVTLTPVANAPQADDDGWGR